MLDERKAGTYVSSNDSVGWHWLFIIAFILASTITGLTVGDLALIFFIFVELKVFKSSDFTRSIILTRVVQFALFGATERTAVFANSLGPLVG